MLQILGDRGADLPDCGVTAAEPAELRSSEHQAGTRCQHKGRLGAAHAMKKPVMLALALASLPIPLAAQAVGDVFRDCAVCPEMVVVPPGSFMMGSPDSEEGRSPREGPQHRVMIDYQFAVSVYEVTFEEWDTCVLAGGCGGHEPDDESWGPGPAAGDQRELERRLGVRGLADGADGGGVSPVERGGVGVRGAGGDGDGAVLGRERAAAVPVCERLRRRRTRRARR